MTAFSLRSATGGDAPFLHAMLYEAAYWRTDQPRPPMDLAVRSPELSVYIDGWGRAGDRGLIAAVDGSPVGAAWYRVNSPAEPGYGFVDSRTPELSIAVAAANRGIGLGRALLAGLMVQARLDAVPALSLSVEDDNPAKVLYERFGFEPVAQRDNATTMIARLRYQADH